MKSHFHSLFHNTILCLVLFLPTSLLANQITVTSATDGNPGALRAAVASANSGDTINFSVLLAAATHTLTEGEISIDKDLTIIGNIITPTLIDADNDSRIFNVSGNITVALRNLDLRNGLAPENGGALLITDATVVLTDVDISESTVTGTAVTHGGGAIANIGGSLTLNGGTLQDNDAIGATSSGGAIINLSGGFLTATDTEFSNNTATRAGGAIEDNSGVEGLVSLNQVEIRSNETGPSPGNGGGVHISGPGNINITGGDFFDNKATAEGGGLWNGTGVMTISAARFTENIASGNDADQGGGGLFILGGSVSIGSATNFIRNEADGASGSGGAILNAAGSLISTGNFYTENSANRAGGAIEDVSGAGTQVTIIDDFFANNSTGASPGNGGAIHITGDGLMDVTGSTFQSNTAASEGGALWNGTGTMTINESLVELNEAEGNGPDNGGGGVFNAGGTLIIGNSTSIRENQALGTAGSGGGVFNDAGGTLSMNDVTLFGNISNRAGGGIEDNSGAGGMVTLENVRLSRNVTNTSPGNGGGVHITGPGNIDITGGTVNRNTAGAEGGGLWNGAGIMNVSGVTIDNNIASGDGPDQGGGGIFNFRGTVNVIAESMITNNTADGTAGSGGGILNDTLSTLTVRNSTISGNTSNRAGGGIEDNSRESTVVTLDSVNILNNTTNTSPGNGGGIHITGRGDMNITGGVINNNNAGAEGGGLWNGAGIMNVSGVTIDDNVASGDGADQGGGGIFNLSGTLNVLDSTIITNNVANGAAGSGGGILNDSGATLNVTDSRIEGNTSNRAGGGIEDNSRAMGMVTLTNVLLLNNVTNTSPGNGGGVHITGPGNIDITGGMVNGNSAGAEGGGLWNGAGTMNVVGVMIDNNVASGDGPDQGGGGIFNFTGGTVNVMGETMISNNSADGAAGSGGGIMNDTLCTLTVRNSTIMGNTSNRAGGGIEDNSRESTVVTLDSVRILNNVTNTSPGNGGGVHITGAGEMIINAGSITGNTAGAEGGGLWNGAGTMTVTGSTISGNSANGADADQGGGGIFNVAGTVIVRTSTVSGNTAATNGGGITNAGILVLDHATIAFNEAGGDGGGISQTTAADSTFLSGTLLAKNIVTGSGQDISGTGPITSGGFNIIEFDDLGTFVADGTDVVGTDGNGIGINLSPLADNGGATKTHALNCPSIAVNGGSAANDSTDQRGEAVFGSNRDVGAFELQTVCVVSSNDLPLLQGSKVYPNPVSGGELNVSLTTAYASGVTLRLVDAPTGRLVLTRPIQTGVTTLYPNLRPGVYVVQLVSAEAHVAHRIIVGK